MERVSLVQDSLIRTYLEKYVNAYQIGNLLHIQLYHIYKILYIKGSDRDEARLSLS